MSGVDVSQPAGFEDKVAFVWSVAELLRGDFKAHEYGQVMLPFMVLRRLECVLQSTKAGVIAKEQELRDRVENVDPILKRAAGQWFYNVSRLDLATLLNDPRTVEANLKTYIASFSLEAQEVLRAYGFDEKIARLDKAGLLYQVVAKFAELDLSPPSVPNEAMGYIFEELLRRFSEMSNETAGEHFTPREVIRLMVSILFAADDKALSGQMPVRTLYDPACGTGGMLTVAQDHLRELNPDADLQVFGQELNPETWAVCRSDLMIKGQDPSHIQLGNSFTEDGFAGKSYDYMLANPPFGVDWKKYAAPIKDEHDNLGLHGRFGPGLPRVSDGSLLFLMHMISKMKPVARDPAKADGIEGGSRLAIVFSGSPLFAGAVGGGESEIRRWVIERDWLEGIVALPDQLFYNTGISTYFWILTNRKSENRRGNVVLVDARNSWSKMTRSLGDKRKYIPAQSVEEITRLYVDAIESRSADPRVKIVANREFGFARITVERPLRLVWRIDENGLLGAPANARPVLESGLGRSWQDEAAARSGLLDLGVDRTVLDAVMTAISQRSANAEPVYSVETSDVEPDPDLRDHENISIPEGFEAMSPHQQSSALRALADRHLCQEIRPYHPDAWVDHSKTKVGYSLNIERHFFNSRSHEAVDLPAAADVDLLARAVEQMWAE
jgi:type I restriction enzyme M protein